ncbi:MAG: hypothetical protein A2W01_09680 [Candidatus Solincola sediminis]|uniref:Oxidoreductase molybdopterin-binding domain-containing protein n=1 Tax=Candidatus Solincola sediminis TaxID=1797199 RepID=A0A1F2WQG6_9ACTN|nr:MAG: hypothetical protein A2Y75_00760 [Candidatus Solincola sediminis]OFW61441.1 MAG: hypothetical protein A2W01_09680 [Candidatus Solincola sediminis]
MEKVRPWLGIAIVLILIIGGGAFFLVRNRTPKTSIELPDGGAAEVTPTDKMRVRTAEGEPDIEIGDYRLTIDGFVDGQLSLTLDDLRAFQAEERLVDLPCVEGWTETAVWKGVRLISVLERAGVLVGADNVVFSSPGGYTTSLTIADIEESDPLLAYEVNGEILPKNQGYPVRLVVPDKLGYKWIKWVTGIEVIAGEYKGYWESRGYSNEADARGR